jgi:hypothetical protein
MKDIKNKYSGIHKEFFVIKESDIPSYVEDAFFKGDKEELKRLGVTYNPEADEKDQLPEYTDENGKIYYKWSDIKTNKYNLPSDLKLFTGDEGLKLLNSTASWKQLREFGFSPTELKDYMLTGKKISTNDFIADLQGMMRVLTIIEGNEKQFSFIVYVISMLAQAGLLAKKYTVGVVAIALGVVAKIFGIGAAIGGDVILSKDALDVVTGDEDIRMAKGKQNTTDEEQGKNIFKKLHSQYLKAEKFKPRHVEAYAYLGFADDFENLSYKHVDGHVEPNVTDLKRDFKDLITKRDGGMMAYYLKKHQRFINERFSKAKKQIETKKADAKIFEDQVKNMLKALNMVYKHTPTKEDRVDIEKIKEKYAYTVNKDGIATFDKLGAVLKSHNTLIRMVDNVIKRNIDREDFSLDEGVSPIDPLTGEYRPKFHPWLLRILQQQKSFIQSSQNFGRTKIINEAIVKMGPFKGWDIKEFQRFIFMWYTPNVEEKEGDFIEKDEKLPIKDEYWKPSANLHGKNNKRVGYEEILIKNEYNKLIEHELIDWSKFYNAVYQESEGADKFLNYIYKTLGTRFSNVLFPRSRTAGLKQLPTFTGKNAESEIAAAKIRFNESKRRRERLLLEAAVTYAAAAQTHKLFIVKEFGGVAPRIFFGLFNEQVINGNPPSYNEGKVGWAFDTVAALSDKRKNDDATMKKVFDICRSLEAVLVLRLGTEGHGSLCRVTNTASLKGSKLGPLLYDIAFSFVNDLDYAGVICDRVSVSEHAKTIYTFIIENRPQDFNIYYLDNEYDNYTPTGSDNITYTNFHDIHHAKNHGIGARQADIKDGKGITRDGPAEGMLEWEPGNEPNDPLDMVFSIKNPLPYSDMLIDDTPMHELFKEVGLQDHENILKNLLVSFFNKVYSRRSDR